MRNTLGDLNNTLFEMIERLMDDEQSRDQFEKELDRAKAVTALSSQIVKNGNLVLNAKKYMDETDDADAKLPPMLEAGHG